MREEEERSWIESALEHAGAVVWELDVPRQIIQHRGRLWPNLPAPAMPLAAPLTDYHDSIHEDDRERTFAGVAALLAGDIEQLVVQFRMERSDGVRRWVEGRSRVTTRGPDGRPEHIRGTVQDCTERVEAEAARDRAEEQLRQSEARFRSFITTTADALCCYECDHPIPGDLPCAEQFERLLRARLVEANEAHVRWRSEAGQPEPLGSALCEAHPTYIALVRELHRAVVASPGRSGTVAEARLHFQPPGAAEEPRELVGRAQVIHESGHLVRVWCSFTDVTERSRAARERAALEAQARHGQKMEGLGTLTGGMAHDFNNVLAAILAEADLGLEDLDDLRPDAAREALENVRIAAERGAALTAKLLNFARRHPAVRRPVRLDRLVRDLWPMLRRLLPETIEMRLETPTPLWVIADPGQLEQALVNLLVNARDAIAGQPGEISVRCEAVAYGAAELRAHRGARPGEFVQVSVSDSGGGVPFDLQERIFEPFFTTKAVGAGTGLGLAVVYSILRQHDGFVELRCVPGVSSRFTIAVPRAAEPASLPETPAARGPAPLGRETILLVEDDPSVRDSSRRVLTSGGYTVLVAKDGADARAQVDRIPHVDLLVLDVILPQENGPALYRALADRVPRVLFTSGYGAGNLDPALLEAIEHHFVPKPCGRDELLGAVRRALDAP